MAKTLVYFASGEYHSRYEELALSKSFDKIYLVNKHFDKHYKSPGNKFTNLFFKNKERHVVCLEMDAIKACDKLKELNVKIDYFVCVNEGLYEGGGTYKINSDFFMGYCMPLLQDEYVHIMDLNYYAHRPHMNWPFKKQEIFSGDERFIDASIFTTEGLKGNGNVFIMKKELSHKQIASEQIKVFLKRDSIWSDYNTLDYVGILPDKHVAPDINNYLLKKGKVHNIRCDSFSDIITYCNVNRIEKLGLMPWMRGDYHDILKELKGFNQEYPKEIHFYHLNCTDYKLLYE